MPVRREQVAAALRYMQQLRDRANEFGGGVAKNLTERAQSAGGLAYEALTSDPNIGRMTTAEYAQAADRPTPRLDQTASELGTLGRAVLTQPIETGKTIVRSEVERARGALESPQAAGEYAGSLIDPLRLASALRTKGPIAEIDVYHGSPHRFEEFDASKIGTGEGAQAYGHGIYLAESPDVAKSYQTALASERGFRFGDKTNLTRQEVQDLVNAQYPGYLDDVARPSLVADYVMDDMVTGLIRPEGKVPRQFKPGSEREKLFKQLQKEISHADKGALYTADLPDEMVDRMLDWDKPLSEQSSAIKKVMGSRYESWKNSTGQDLYEALSEGLGGDKATSDWLRENNIPGIRYLDAGSRGQGGSGTRNFVVFPGEEKKVKILKRE